jgi:nucleoside-diphosphate-sugar epimerase
MDRLSDIGSSRALSFPAVNGGACRASWSGRKPALVITGASGFLGRHLIAALRERYIIFGLARRTPGAVGLAPHRNVTWYQVDIAEREPLESVFRSLRQVPGPKIVIHLAAHYDFTGEKSPEYERTNVHGLRNVLELSRSLVPELFVFPSSLAACAFPTGGGALTEESPADGDHHYAVSKRIGEAMLREYVGQFRPVIVRLAAVFSDWCEYPPLYSFLGTWLGQAWNRRVLGGTGQSAIPYLHVRCAANFFQRLLEMRSVLRPLEVLIASPDGCVSHLEAFEAATLAFLGHRMKPILMPALVSRAGLRAIDLAGRLQGNRPFERPWMGRYIDLRMNTDARRTRERIGWSAMPRLDVLRRMPFLVENLKNDPIEWHRRNLAALKTIHLQPNLKLLHLFEAHEHGILEASMAQVLDPYAEALFPNYQRILGEDELRWAKRQLFLQLKNTIRTRDLTIFKAYCRHVAERRHRQGFVVDEVCRMIASERDLCIRVLRADPASADLVQAIHDHVSMTFLVGLDEIQDAFDVLEGRMLPLNV